MIYDYLVRLIFIYHFRCSYGSFCFMLYIFSANISLILDNVLLEYSDLAWYYTLALINTALEYQHLKFILIFAINECP
jgi:hypothetical protein